MRHFININFTLFQSKIFFESYNQRWEKYALFYYRNMLLIYQNMLLFLENIKYELYT